MTKIIPANPGFAVLEFEPDGLGVKQHPVIAWRITEGIGVVPITLSARIDEEEDHFLLRPDGWVYFRYYDLYGSIGAARAAYHAAQK